MRSLSNPRGHAATPRSPLCTHLLLPQRLRIHGKEASHSPLTSDQARRHEARSAGPSGGAPMGGAPSRTLTLKRFALQAGFYGFHKLIGFWLEPRRMLLEEGRRTVDETFDQVAAAQARRSRAVPGQ
jgi:hypothetical protein